LAKIWVYTPSEINGLDFTVDIGKDLGVHAK